MKTEPIFFVPAAAQDVAAIRDVLARHYRRAISAPDVIERFGEPTVASIVFRLQTSSGDFVFKLPKWRGTDAHAARQQTLLLEVADAYRRHGLPVAETVKTDTGAWCAIDGDRIALVQRLVSGEHFRGTDEELRAAGQGIGLLHAISEELATSEASFAARVRHELLVEKPFPDCAARWKSGMRSDLLAEGPCVRANTCKLLRENVENIDRLLGRVREAWGRLDVPLPAGIIHNDWNPNNGLYGPDGRLVAVLDFELVCHDRFVIDIANGLMRHEANVLLNRPDADIRQATTIFLDAYASARPLSDVERRAIPIAMMERELQRLLRRLWMHLYEHDRMGSFMDKISTVVLPNLLSIEERYGWML